MNYTVLEELSPHVIRIQKDDTSYLAFQIAGNKRPDANKLQTDRKQDIGLVFNGESSTEWKPLFNMEKDEAIYACGPDLKGHFLSEFVANPDFSNIAKLKELANLANRFQQEKRPFPTVLGHSVFFLDDGGIFLLPPSIVSRQSFFIKESETKEMETALHNPDIADSYEAFSYTLGILLYRQITGSMPFNGNTVEEIRDKIRLGQTALAYHVNPSIKAEPALKIQHVFKGGRITLKEWLDLLTKYESEGWAESLNKQEIEQRINQGQKIRDRMDKNYSRRLFFRRYKTRLLSGGAVAIVLGSVAWTMISNILAPPVTVGMEPEEVVQLYYDSINTFDPVTMEDCFEDDEGKDQVTQASFMHVNSKMRMSNEGETGYIIAQEWENEGRPSYNPKYVLIGVANVKIQETKRVTNQLESGVEELITFETEYIEWIPLISDEIDLSVTTPPKSVEYIQRDRLSLRLYDDYWAIYKMERISSEEVKETE